MLTRTLAFVALLAGVAVPSQRSAPPPAPPVPYGQPIVVDKHSFDIQPESAGDCRLLGGKITLYPDGTGTFQTTTLTYHTRSGDYWHVSLEGFTSGGTQILAAGPFTGPRMNDGNPPPEYPWEDHFRFDRSIYHDIVRIHLNSSC